MYNVLNNLSKAVWAIMPHFPLQHWKNYKIKLRPSDPIRRFLCALGLPDLFPYFDSSYIYFDMRFSIAKTNRKHVKALNDIVYYEWFLYDRNNKPIQDTNNNTVRFYHENGNGKVEFSKARVYNIWDTWDKLSKAILLGKTPLMAPIFE
jgi:hypothetical protein